MPTSSRTRKARAVTVRPLKLAMSKAGIIPIYMLKGCPASWLTVAQRVAVWV